MDGSALAAHIDEFCGEKFSRPVMRIRDIGIFENHLFKHQADFKSLLSFLVLRQPVIQTEEPTALHERVAVFLQFQEHTLTSRLCSTATNVDGGMDTQGGSQNLLNLVQNLPLGVDVPIEMLPHTARVSVVGWANPNPGSRWQ